MRPAVMVGGALAFLAQGLPAIWLGVGWAGAIAASGGECGYDGTCSDRGSVTLAAAAFVIMVGVEAITGSVLAWIAWRRRGRTGGFGGLLAERVAWAVVAGFGAAWLLMVQAGAIDQRGAARHPGDDAAQGSFFITWNVRAMVLETLLTALTVTICVWWRRRRRGD